jgi:hypothetical protein
MNKIKKPTRKLIKEEEMQEWGKNKCRTTVAIKNQRCKNRCEQ